MMNDLGLRHGKPKQGTKLRAATLAKSHKNLILQSEKYV